MKNRNMIKKGLACVMAATMTIGLAACGGSNGGGDDVSEADFSDPESIKGTITVGGWPSGDDGFKAAMDGFNKEAWQPQQFLSLEHLPDAEIAAHRQQTRQHPPMHLPPVEIW